MGKLVAKAKMQTSVAGNKPYDMLIRLWTVKLPCKPESPMHFKLQSGFTLIELMVVLLVLALSSSLVVMSTRDSSQQTLEREADRLINVLEAARAQARSSSTALLWQSDARGYSISAVTDPQTQQQFQTWYLPGTRSEPTSWLISAEPVQSATRLTLLMEGAPNARLSVATDGAASFKVMP